MQITFPRPYKGPPKVACWFTQILQPHERLAITCSTTEVKRNSFVLSVTVPQGCEFEHAKVMWLAWDAEHDGKKIRSGSTEVKSEGKHAGVDHTWQDGPLPRELLKPFIGICSLDFENKRDCNLGVFCDVRQSSKSGFNWDAVSWSVRSDSTP